MAGDDSLRREAAARGLLPVRSSATHFRFPSPAAPATCLITHRTLVQQMIRKEIATRYRGSVLGVLWSLANPLLMLGIYTFVFGVVLEARWQEQPADRGDFAMVLFAGLIVFWLFADCVGRAPDLVVSHSVLVKKLLFPVEILPWVAVGSALFHTAISVVVLLAAHAAWIGPPPPTAALLPLVLLPLVALVLGLCWSLASIGVFVRDVGPLVAMALSAAMFLSPIFYPARAIPEQARWILALNPIALVVEEVRAVLLFGRLPNGPALLALGVVGWLAAWLGLAWFLKSRKAFADVL